MRLNPRGLPPPRGPTLPCKWRCSGEDACPCAVHAVQCIMLWQHTAWRTAVHMSCPGLSSRLMVPPLHHLLGTTSIGSCGHDASSCMLGRLGCWARTTLWRKHSRSHAACASGFSCIASRPYMHNRWASDAEHSEQTHGKLAYAAGSERSRHHAQLQPEQCRSTSGCFRRHR